MCTDDSIWVTLPIISPTCALWGFNESFSFHSNPDQSLNHPRNRRHLHHPYRSLRSVHNAAVQKDYR